MTNDNFSQLRMKHLWNFYWPTIRIQFLIGGGIVLLMYLAALFFTILQTNGSSEDLFFVSFYAMCCNFARYVYFAGPLLFAICRQRSIATSIPASWQEKATFMFGYIFVVFPALLAAVWYGASFVASFFTPCYNVVSSMNNYIADYAGLPFPITQLASKSMPSSAISDTSIAALCAIMITYSRNNRLIMGIVGIVIGVVAYGIIGFIIGVCSFLFSDFLNIVVENPEQATNSVLTFIMNLMPYLTLLSILVTIILCYFTTRKIRYRQN